MALVNLFTKQTYGCIYLCLVFQRLVTERDSLKEVNEELKCTQIHVGGGEGLSIAEQTQAELLSLPPEIK